MTGLQALIAFFVLGLIVLSMVMGINKGVRKCEDTCVDSFKCNNHFFSGPTCDCGDDEYETGKCTTCAKDGKNYTCS